VVEVGGGVLAEVGVGLVLADIPSVDEIPAGVFEGN